MKVFSSVVAIVGVLSATGNAVNITFLNLDGQNRTIHFTPSAGKPEIEDYNLTSNGNVTVKMPFQWVGRFRTMLKGERWEEPSVIGEVSLDSFEDKQWIDVSAIGKNDDNTGIMHIYSTETNKTVHNEWSGCYEFPCGNAYLKPHDQGTRTTSSKNLTVEVGGHPSTLTKNAKDRARRPVIKAAIKKQKTPGTKPFWGVWQMEVRV